MEELAGPEWWLDRKGEVPQGMQPYFRLPILHYYDVRMQPTACSRLLASPVTRATVLYWFVLACPGLC